MTTLKTSFNLVSLIATTFALALVSTTILRAQTVRNAPVEVKLGCPATSLKPDKTVLLYPKGQNPSKYSKTDLSPVLSNGLTGPEVAEKNGFIANVTDSARMDFYFPENPNGQMAVICPGGSYFDLSSWNEGIYVAKWMKERGITACVLKYRLPNGHTAVPLIDVQNAFKYCRANAKEWSVKQIGIVGFSAGGHLGSTVETMYNDKVTKPDFAVLLYPVISMEKGITHNRTCKDLLGTPESWHERDKYSFSQWCQRQSEYRDLIAKYSSQNNVTSSTPPTFISLSTDDKLVPVKNSVLFSQALVNQNVPVEMHIYPSGGHGWGFTTPELGKDNLGDARKEFSDALERWLGSVLEGKIAPENVNVDATAYFEKKPDETILLYPEGQNSDKGLSEAKGPGESNGVTGPEIWNKYRHLRNVGDSARFEVYLASKPNGLMVVVCPGGGYMMSSQNNEGRNVARWMLERGICVSIVHYRLPESGHSTVPLTDVQNTLRYCRAHAQEWGVSKIGVAGFSAGGHLAASASTLFTDSVTRPDFSILFYPVITMEEGITHQGSKDALIGKVSQWSDTQAYKNAMEKYSLENRVSSQTPPTIIILCADDSTVPPENSLRYYQALVDHKVNSEIHIFPYGGHGWGFKASEASADKIGKFRGNLDMSLERFLSQFATGK